MGDGSKIPEGLRYTKEHEWAKLEGNVVTMGITDYAQHSLTDVVFVELPEVGKKVEQMKSLAVVESVKSVSDVYAPVSGEVVDVNKPLPESPQLVNEDPYGKGWIAKIKADNPADVEPLMDAVAYAAYLKTLKH